MSTRFCQPSVAEKKVLLGLLFSARAYHTTLSDIDWLHRWRDIVCVPDLHTHWKWSRDLSTHFSLARSFTQALFSFLSCNSLGLFYSRMNKRSSSRLIDFSSYIQHHLIMLNSNNKHYALCILNSISIHIFLLKGRVIDHCYPFNNIPLSRLFQYSGSRNHGTSYIPKSHGCSFSFFAIKCIIFLIFKWIKLGREGYGWWIHVFA